MSPNRIILGLGTLALVMFSGLTAFGQDHELQGMQLFEPADVRPYGNWAEQTNGLFFTFDGIFWQISAPNKTSIGHPTVTPTAYYGPLDTDGVIEHNDLSTGQYRAKWKQGDRIELGYIEEHHGILMSFIETNRQTQHLGGSGTTIIFDAPPFGPRGVNYLEGIVGQVPDPVTNQNVDVIAELPTKFDHVMAINRTTFQGAEVMYMYRPHQFAHGGTAEILLGGRYLDLNDAFEVTASGGTLGDSAWNTYAKNRIAGPEIGLRLYKPWGRLAFSTEGRFTAGINSETIRQDGMIGTFLAAPNGEGLPRLLSATGFNHSASFTEFTPLVEWRAEAHIRLTNLLSFKAGYTVMWMNNIARACDMVDYTLSSTTTMGITTLNKGNRQDALIQGLNIGVELNR